MSKIPKAELKSMDIAVDKRRLLAQLFPEAVTESRTDAGELVHAVDFEKLKAVLGQFSEILDNQKERYGMTWPGKNECLKIIQQPSIATLKPCREESVNFDETENLFIEGDNLEVLKLLQKAYYGKIKMIYIDPPYNTGKEFIYPDKFSENLETYLAYTGQADAEGRKFNTNTEAEGRFHSNWMSMIYPRLYLARNLLCEDGAIFISIDDHEFENLRRIGDEIFGEECHLGTFLWHRRQNADSRNESNVSPDHDFVVAYSRSSSAKLQGRKIDASKYKNPDNDPRGPWASIDLSGLATKEQRPNLHYDITDPKTGNTYPPNPRRGWSKSKSVVEQMISEGRIIFPPKISGRPREKKFLADLQSMETGFSTWLDSDAVGFTQEGTRAVSEIFGGKFFDFPKPVNFIKSFCQQATESHSIILDFFSGSSTTAHAVIDLNKQDGGKRKFIMVQLPEPCSDQAEAYKAGYKTIADIGKERIRRVIKKFNEEDAGGNNLKGEKKPDLGFRVYKLGRSNFRVWDSEEAAKAPDSIAKQLELHEQHIDPHAGQEDILYELLLKAGFPPTTQVTKMQMAGKDVYSVADGSLLICLERNITKELIKAMADVEPLQVISLDEGFKGNDQLKSNAVQTFKARGQGKGKEIRTVFRTV